MPASIITGPANYWNAIDRVAAATAANNERYVDDADALSRLDELFGELEGAHTEGDSGAERTLMIARWAEVVEIATKRMEAWTND